MTGRLSMYSFIRRKDSDQLDLVAFILAFLLGIALYITLHFFLQLHPAIVSAAVIFVMITYAILIANVPRLRVRLDQAGDNAYYLGLLFTLVSMAFALYEFGQAIHMDGLPTAEESGVRQIIANFGIALASTIVGIFLRVVLNQMRIDPATVEGMSRIELAEAAQRVRAILDTVTMDIGRFHAEMQQRYADNVIALAEDARKTSVTVMDGLEQATRAMITGVERVQTEVIGATQNLTRATAQTAMEATGAIERLRAVEAPPLLLNKRLERVTVALGDMGEKSAQIIASMEDLSQRGAVAVSSMALAGTTLDDIARRLANSQVGWVGAVEATAQKVGIALESVGKALEDDHRLLVGVQQGAARAADESVRAGAAAVEVLTHLTELSRGLTRVLMKNNEDGGDGRAEQPPNS
jgi:hypothetical protein